MSAQKKDHKASDWFTSATGRLYRRLEIDGVRYTQWDNVKGPVYADSSTPRTTDPRNLSGEQNNSAQRPESRNALETGPAAVGHEPLTVTRSNPLPHTQTTSSDRAPSRSYPYDSYLPENHQPAYSIFPREDRGQTSAPYLLTGISQQRTTAPSSGGNDDINDEPDNRLPSLPNRVNQGRHAVTKSPSQNIVSAQDTPQPNQTEHRQGASRGVRPPDRSRYYDRDDKAIHIGATTQHRSRQETRADHEFSADDLTERFASMGAQRGRQEVNERSRTSRHPTDDGLSTQATPRDRQASSRPRSDSRDPPQQAGRDTRTASTGTDMERHGPQRSSIDVQEEKSKSRERPVIRQLQEHDGASTTRPVQGQRKDPFEQQTAHRVPHEQLRKQLQRHVPDDGYFQRAQAINNGRRLSVTHGSDLPTISESGLLKTTKIVGDNKGRSEVMDERYRVRKDPKTFFAKGRVFAMLWHENAGNEGTDLSEGRYYKGKYGEKIYSTIRRMVVVNEKDGHCTCVPIATYGRQGTLKYGLSEAEIKAHAVIYMVGTSSAAAPGERIVKNPIAVNPAKEDQKLHPMSRINFDKIYTIEHNVKVMNVGKVVHESLHNLSLYFINTHFGG